MILTKLVILDRNKEEANSFTFSDKSNIITSEDSNVGKSCLLKSIYYALGFPIKTIQENWILKNKLFKWLIFVILGLKSISYIFYKRYNYDES